MRSFCNKVQRRANYLQGQISPAHPANFGNLEIAALTDWQVRRDLGNAELSQERDKDGNMLLRISTTDGCTASWRTIAVLDSGRYQFEARIKTEGVVLPPDDPRAGAELRVSRYRNGQKNSGDRDWTPITFPFEVPEDQSEVELVCELRAIQGTIWYDLKSLRLKRR